MYTKQQLINLTLNHTLFPLTTLQKAIAYLQFIQIDPIRSPAQAQDLILRQRVKNYHMGDIDKKAPSLHLEEDFLYAHGYLLPQVWQLLHPRNKVHLTEIDKEVLNIIQNIGIFHPTEIEKYFEKKREVNWWGGYSRSTKMALDRLHYYGLVRVAGRKNGTRLYQAFSPSTQHLSLKERLRNILLILIDIMTPVTAKTLSQSLHRIHKQFGDTRPVLEKLIQTGEVQKIVVDGIPYFLLNKSYSFPDIPSFVKFLTPFDPVVRDRFRFEHLWGWLYQFEAYIPAAKRIRGYYAMPLLWKDTMIGWANGKVIQKEFHIDFGFITSRPKAKEFEEQLEAEIERMKEFLQLNA